jgi:hypothetical protein
VLSDQAFRERLLGNTDNEAVHEFWEEFERSSHEQDNLARPIKHRIRRFYSNPHFYRITCHPQVLNFASLVRERKIILMALNMEDTQRLSEGEQQVLGSLVVSRIQMAGMSRACQERGFYLFVDEAQHFVTTSVPTMLTQARQFNLSVTLGNQFLKQLVGETLETVRGVISTWVFFQLGDEDAPIAERYTQPNFEASDFIQMDKHQAVVRMDLNEKSMPAFNLAPRRAYDDTDERKRKEGEEKEQRIRQLSIKNYTPMSKEEVTAWLRERYPRGEKGKEGSSEDDGEL